MDLIYHGCAYANADGTQKMIAKGDFCLFPTNRCFWKDPREVDDYVKTRSMTKRQRCVSRALFNRYFKEKASLQSVSQYFETFLCFTKFSFHHK